MTFYALEGINIAELMVKHQRMIVIFESMTFKTLKVKSNYLSYLQEQAVSELICIKLISL